MMGSRKEMAMKRLNVAIVEDGDGKVHIFTKVIDENIPHDFDAFQERMQGLGQAMGGALIMMYRKCDVIENVRL